MSENDNMPLAGVKVFLVEDEAFIAMAIIDKLKEAGAASVEHALTLFDASMALKTLEFDVAILDLRLPDGSSDDLARQLIENGKPVVFHSGHADIDMLETEFPTSKICHKPCRHSEFVTAIRELLNT